VTNTVSRYDQGDFPDVSSSVSAVCSWYGPVDLDIRNKPDFPADKADTIGFEELFLGQVCNPPQEQLRMANPLTYISDTTPPFLLLHGNKDLTVPLHQSERLHDELEKHGISVDLYVIDNADHAAVEFFQNQVMKIIIRFFDKHLKYQEKRLYES
jgi:acetyl esterase/lipase